MFSVSLLELKFITDTTKKLENLFTNHFFFGLIILLPDDVTSLLLADAEGVFLSINGYFKFRESLNQLKAIVSQLSCLAQASIINAL